MRLEETRPLLSGVARTRPRKHLTWRLLTYSGIGLFFLIVFNLIFLPRTSLRRDLKRLHGSRVSLDDVERTLFDSVNAQSIRTWSQRYTQEAHLAGEGLDLAEWTRDQWRHYGLDAKIETYDIYLNYPVDNGLKLLNNDGSVKYKASLEEAILEEDPTSGLQDAVPVFHGYSASGNVTGKLVYANFGTKHDYDLLVSKGVDFKDKIVIVKYGQIFRGLKIKFAQELGAAGVIIYSDPQEDLPFTEKNGYAAYPDGPARHPSSVQRGSVQFLSYGPGDPTTPGYPSKGDVERKDPYDNIPRIPSLPISYVDALPFLEALNGKGLSGRELGDNWKGELDVDYNVGPSEVEVNLYNEQDYDIRPTNNVIGKIEGIIKDEIIIIGNHRDAWIAGGAADPNSGSAVLMELAKGFAELKQIGWQPLRTIIFASWDGEEYGLLGSTEWGEEYGKFIKHHVVAYLNLDVAVSGSSFGAGASPLLHNYFSHVTKRVHAPNGKGNLHEKWRAQEGGATINYLGSGSDYTVFLDRLGIPSLDFGFTCDPAAGDAIYQYHSNYDSFYWMDTYGDPDWKHHVTATQLLGLLTVTLSEEELLQFKITEYSALLDKYLTKLEHDFADQIKQHKHDRSFKRLRHAVDRFVQVSKEYDAYTTQLQEEWTQDYAWYRSYKKFFLLVKIRIANAKLRQVEQTFLTKEGLDGREWFKHSVFAPGRYTGYSGALLPGLTDALEDNDYEGILKWTGIITGQIKAVNGILHSGNSWGLSVKSLGSRR